MTDKKVVVLNENFPMPLRALALIKEHSSWWMGRPQIPEPEDSELHKAHNVVSAWIADIRRAHGYPGTEEKNQSAELDPKQAKLGVCPECHTNDGYLIVGRGVSSVCHRHRVRWEITGRELGDLVQTHRAGLSDEDHARVMGYTPVEPAWLPGFSPRPEPPLRAAGHLQQVETETFTQGMARMWWGRDRSAPEMPYGGYGYTPRFWCPPAELIAAARRAIKEAEAKHGPGPRGPTA